MNLDNIMNDDNFYILNENNNVAYYSLLIGITEYFRTYNRICIYLSKYQKGNKDSINRKAKENVRFLKSYLNIAIHIQHFFELETKRLLEKEHVLFSLDDKGDPIILNKLIKNMSLSSEEIKKLKSVEFSEALIRLRKLVDCGVVTDEIAVIFRDNHKLLGVLNQLRNTTIHKGRKIMHYCELDELFSRYIFPLVKDLLEHEEYSRYLSNFKQVGIYDAIIKIINEGKKPVLDYSVIAYEKEMVRCKEKRSKIEKLNEETDEKYIKQVIVYFVHLSPSAR